MTKEEYRAKKIAEINKIKTITFTKEMVIEIISQTIDEQRNEIIKEIKSDVKSKDHNWQGNLRVDTLLQYLESFKKTI